MSVELTETKKIWFKKIRDNKKIYTKDKVVLEHCKGKLVLDVGCVGQDIDYNSSNWIHSQVRDVAKNLLGVDINRDGIKELNRQGYNVVHFEELEESEKFDTILMLDVIEHVNNPVEFLENYIKFLKDDGEIIVTTPNSNRAINFINILFRNEYSLNYEHTFWLCPKTFMELVNRVEKIAIKDFFWLNHYTFPKNISWKSRLIYTIDKFLTKKRSYFIPNFMFILEFER